MFEVGQRSTFALKAGHDLFAEVRGCTADNIEVDDAKCLVTERDVPGPFSIVHTNKLTRKAVMGDRLSHDSLEAVRIHVRRQLTTVKRVRGITAELRIPGERGVALL